MTAPAPDDERARDPRTMAEWVTFAVAVALVLAVVALVLSEVPGGKVPPSPVAEVGEVEERDGRFFVPVRVENRGERTASDVRVEATLAVDGDEVEEADQLVDFLSGGEVEELEFVFDEDPDRGSLEIRVTGYRLP